jgi:tetratricopeptide (TPR) repeat protein
LCTFIADTFDDGLTRILERYHAGDDTVTAIEQGLRIDPESLDTRFLAHLETIYGGAADSLAELKALSASAKDAIQQERWVEAMSAADRAIGLFPEYVGPQSPYLLKAHGAEGAGDTTAAVDSLAAFYERGGRDPAALAHAARLHQEAGRTETALQVQRTLVRLDPLTAAHHATLGDWASKAGAYDEALTEYRAVLALAPHDRATAHYQVASTLHELGRTEEARRELLYALEIAPRFSPALSLLVEINQ